MKKKIIKFYSINNISINNIFCFSKRAIKQKKQLQQFIMSKNTGFLKTKKNWGSQLYMYKFHILKLKQNQWLNEKQQLKFLFLKSSFINPVTLCTFNVNRSIKLKQLQIWYTFKKFFNKNLGIKIKNFPKLGMLSSHFVHFISKKNISYQTRSKYKAKVANLNSIYIYIYAYAMFLYNYMNLTNNKIFFFTSNLSKQHKWVNEDFYINISNWNTSKKLNEMTNIYDYTLVDYKSIDECSIYIKQYLSETDMIKKEKLFILIKTMLNESQVNLFPLAQKILNEHFVIDCSGLMKNLEYFNTFYNNL